MTAINFLSRYRLIAPLVVFRIAFGAVLFVSTVRFIFKGWVRDFYITPKFHFPFFDWLHPMESRFMYALYACMALAALFICLGFLYRISVSVFFLGFCYAELLDKTYYLNHYYLVTILSFLLIFVPANRFFSLDILRKPELRITDVPAWTILIFRFQLCIIYFFAGLSKLTTDWMIDALPLRIWLPAKSSLPLIGPLLKHEWIAYCFSWGGAGFDLSVPFLLMNKKTRSAGYVLVVIFHTLTAIFFQIGIFPYLMMAATLIFFSGDFHIRLINRIRAISSSDPIRFLPKSFLSIASRRQKNIALLLGAYFLFQLFMPLRFLIYPGKLLWTEEGYRFSWRVMLMEKSGACFFYVKDRSTGRKFEVNNAAFLTPYQERMMETQPDMMLQYAHILQKQYRLQGLPDPEITVQSFVSLNGAGSRLFVDSSVDLAKQRDRLFTHKSWILPYAGR